jgi:N-acetylmuramate 1-kinase
MSDVRLAGVDEVGLARLAACLALKVKAGDCIALHGDLGAGKTTFARAFIRACLADRGAEVPSPTFSIEQVYDTPRFQIAHYDLYRLAGADELIDIGFEERVSNSVTLVEWPSRATDVLPRQRLDVHFVTEADLAQRAVTLVAGGDLAERVARAVTIFHFLNRQLRWHDAHLVFLNGDASTRSYARLIGETTSAILMDAPRQPDGPPVRDGKPYSRIAHLAEDVRPFVAVLGGLKQSRLAAPDLLAHDLNAGLLVVSDVGDLAYGQAVGLGHDQTQMWSVAVDTLIALRNKPFARSLPLPDGTTHVLPRFDRAALEIEVGLLLDWYWPYAKGEPAPTAIRTEFAALWSPVLDRMLGEPPGIFLRDYHSPNLFWRPEQTGTDRVGVIDFQDALAEPWAYDLVSLLQDARVDVPHALEAQEKARYMHAVAQFEPAFDPAEFGATYAAFGAQRNTRLIGLWVRLLQRDNKPNYMKHMARTWDYVERNLAHPSLAELRSWYGRHFPQGTRGKPARG